MATIFKINGQTWAHLADGRMNGPHVGIKAARKWVKKFMPGEGATVFNPYSDAVEEAEAQISLALEEFASEQERLQRLMDAFNTQDCDETQVAAIALSYGVLTSIIEGPESALNLLCGVGAIEKEDHDRGTAWLTSLGKQARDTLASWQQAAKS